MNQLRHMAIFAVIVETGSITAAADSLQLSKSVVSQHLKNLEQKLGITLLKRTTRKQTLTSAGNDFYQHCKTLNHIADQAWHQAQTALEVPKGVIRITAPNALMETLVAPAIAKLIKSFPLLRPELINSDIRHDLIAENIDLAIRVGQSQDSNIKQRRLGEFRDVLCASKELLTEVELPQENIEHLAYIANSWQNTKIIHEFECIKGEKQNAFQFSAEPRCITNSFNTCFTLLEEGAGIGLIPEFRLNSSSSKLKPVYPKHQLPLNPIYALHTFDNMPPQSIKVCLEAIEQELLKHI